MQKIIFLTLLLLFSRDTEVPDFPPPPGTIKLSENLFVDERPITHLDYQHFVYNTKKHNPDLLFDVVPEDVFITYRNKKMWRNPEFYEFPIIGISLDQMQMYCNWRSYMVNILKHNPEYRCANLKKMGISG